MLNEQSNFVRVANLSELAKPLFKKVKASICQGGIIPDFEFVLVEFPQ